MAPETALQLRDKEVGRSMAALDGEASVGADSKVVAEDSEE